MYVRTLTSACVVAGLFAVVSVRGEAQGPVEQAVTWAVEDAGLKWGPCPEFLPTGCQIAVLHGDPGKANADLFFKVPGKSQLPSHWHTSAERMVLVSGELRVTYQGQKPVLLKSGTYAYGPPRVPHSGQRIRATPCVLFIAFESPVDAVAVAEVK